METIARPRLSRNETPDGVECLKGKTYGHLEVIWYSEFVRQAKKLIHYWVVECSQCGKKSRRTTEQLHGDAVELSFCRTCPAEPTNKTNRYGQVQPTKPVGVTSHPVGVTSQPVPVKGLRGKRFGDLSVISFHRKIRIVPPPATADEISKLEQEIETTKREFDFARLMEQAGRETINGESRTGKLQKKLLKLHLHLHNAKKATPKPIVVNEFKCRCERCGRFNIMVKEQDLVSGQQTACLRCEPPNKHMRREVR
jgi:hypothetical protein